MSRAGTALLWLVVLAGCTSVPDRPPTLPPEQAWSQRKAGLAELNRWVVSGRIAIRADNESWHANIHWKQFPDRYTISVIAPLGGGTFRLEGGPKRALLRTPEDGYYVADDPDELMREVLGVSIPVSGLRYWVLGMPQPDLEADYQLDPWGRPTQLRQAGWQVDILRYRDNGDWELPDKLFMTRGRFEVRLVVSDWSTGSIQETASGGSWHE